MSKIDSRMKRKRRIRKKILGTKDKPRLSVFRSLRYVYAQLIDDLNGKSLASASSLDKEKAGGNKAAAAEVGALIAAKAQALKISEVKFDRNGFLYHGVVQALADGARKAGLKF
ncbi:MAG: 50S ribosomal protein L18 [Deltaproteobacteria bacterium]|nr:50S ribosomal protein L18 [Deltaproteobacteria bacterium]